MTQADIPAAPPHADPIFAQNRRASWVRLRTLVILRWIAIVGQLTAITISDRLFELQLELGWLYLIVGAAVISNLLATFLYPENKRLSEGQMAALLIFDMAQLSALLAFAGGLNNPFALLILAQVSIAAAALQLRSTVLVSVFAIALISLIAVFHAPLVGADGRILTLPALFIFGFWAAIVIGVGFQAVYARRVTTEVTAMSDALAATQMALAREQKLTDLGGVVAAAAHELGTPLATISLVSQELLNDVASSSELRDDAQLIRDQAERCRIILRSMGRAGKDDTHLRRAPIVSVMEEAAEPHLNRGKTILYDIQPQGDADPRQPIIWRKPETIHGIRNLIQNAVDFAKDTVWIGVRWTDTKVTLRIADNGPGFPLDVLPRLGDPFVRRRRDVSQAKHRVNYEGMGLGLFIAKTLLERSGGEISFANGANRKDRFGWDSAQSGAVVEIVWDREALIAADVETQQLGENPPII